MQQISSSIGSAVFSGGYKVTIFTSPADYRLYSIKSILCLGQVRYEIQTYGLKVMIRDG